MRCVRSRPARGSSVGGRGRAADAPPPPPGGDAAHLDPDDAVGGFGGPPPAAVVAAAAAVLVSGLLAGVGPGEGAPLRPEHVELPKGPDWPPPAPHQAGGLQGRATKRDWGTGFGDGVGRRRGRILAVGASLHQEECLPPGAARGPRRQRLSPGALRRAAASGSPERRRRERRGHRRVDRRSTRGPSPAYRDAGRPRPSGPASRRSPAAAAASAPSQRTTPRAATLSPRRGRGRGGTMAGSSSVERGEEGSGGEVWRAQKRYGENAGPVPKKRPRTE